MSDNKPNFETPLDNDKHKLMGESWIKDDWKTKPSLSPRVFNNNVSLVCWSRHPDEESAGKSARPIIARMDPVIWNVFKGILKDTIANPEPGFSTLVLNNKETPQSPIDVQCKVQIGRSEAGVIYIGIKAPNRVPVKFEIQSTIWYHIEDKSGNKWGEQRVSDAVATAWIDRVSAAIDQVLVDKYVDQETVKRFRNEARQRRVSEKSESNLNSDNFNEDSFKAA